MGCDAADIGLTIHPHPTLSETVAFAAEAFDGIDHGPLRFASGRAQEGCRPLKARADGARTTCTRR
jgi:hypothetical protein